MIAVDRSGIAPGLALVAGLACSGCSSMYAKGGARPYIGTDIPGYFAGLRFFGSTMPRSLTEETTNTASTVFFGLLGAWYWVPDLSLTLCADTLLVPIQFTTRWSLIDTEEERRVWKGRPFHEAYDELAERHGAERHRQLWEEQAELRSSAAATTDANAPESLDG